MKEEGEGKREGEQCWEMEVGAGAAVSASQQPSVMDTGIPLPPAAPCELCPCGKPAAQKGARYVSDP